jgi:hypothetical protein
MIGSHADKQQLWQKIQKKKKKKKKKVGVYIGFPPPGLFMRSALCVRFSE